MWFQVTIHHGPGHQSHYRTVVEADSKRDARVLVEGRTAGQFEDPMVKVSEHYPTPEEFTDLIKKEREKMKRSADRIAHLISERREASK